MACRNEPQVQTEVLAEVEIPGEFVEFYEKFHTDTAFQKEHIVFPLSAKTDGSKWHESEWVYHKPFNAMQGDFSRTFENLNGIIIETMQDKTGTVTIQRRFSKMSGEYHLIYYTIHSKFGS